MANIKYVRQARTGRVYPVDMDKPSTKILLARRDISMYDPAVAKLRIEKTKQRIKDLEEAVPSPVDKEIMDDAEELARLEKQVEELEAKQAKEAAESAGIKTEEVPKTEAELEAEQRASILDKDPEMKKIKGMKAKVDLCSYIAIEYGEKHDADAEKYNDLKARAMELREERLFEPVD